MTSIRLARADDAEALAGLTTQLGYPTEPDAQARRLRPLLDRRDDAVLVAVDAGDRSIRRSAATSSRSACAEAART